MPDRTNSPPPSCGRPGPRAWLAVSFLFFQALGDLLLLPFRLAVFLLHRGKTVEKISRLIEKDRLEIR